MVPRQLVMEELQWSVEPQHRYKSQCFVFHLFMLFVVVVMVMLIQARVIFTVVKYSRMKFQARNYGLKALEIVLK